MSFLYLFKPEKLYIIDFDPQFCYEFNTLDSINDLHNVEQFFKLVMIFIFCVLTIDKLNLPIIQPINNWILN